MTTTAAFTFTIADEGSGATFRPWTDGHAVGFQVTAADGTVRYIYLNPSQTEEGEAPNVFVYEGTEGDPNQDGAEHYYEVSA